LNLPFLTGPPRANCGTAAAQTFSYNADGSGAFGNITKSGSPFSFAPTYSATTNRMTNINGFTPTYEGNGNVTIQPAKGTARKYYAQRYKRSPQSD